MKNRKKKMGVILIVAAITLGMFFTGCSQSGDYIDRTVQSYKPQGATVVLIEDGKIAEVRYYGQSDCQTKTAVTDKTTFKIASISKTVTAYAVMRLVDEGRLDLDVPISRYLTRWQLPDSEYNQTKVTLRTLLSHTAGISDSSEYGYSEPLPKIDEALRLRDVHLIREPGEAFEYSSFSGFGICQLIIEEITGMPFETYMEHVIFKELGMDASSYANTSQYDEVLATPYAGINEGAKVVPIVMNGAGGVTTTGVDLAKFVTALISYTQTDTEMFDEQANTQSDGGVYALGIIPRKLSDGRIMYEHNGTLTGWNAQIAFEPESGNGLVVLTNSDKAFYLTYDLMAQWSQNVLGERIEDPAIYGLRHMVEAAAGIMGIITIALASVFVWRIHRGRLIKRTSKYHVAVITAFALVFLVSAWFLLFYTDYLFEWVYNMPDYYLFTLFPPALLWIDIEIVVVALLCFVRSCTIKNSKKLK